MSTIEKVPYPNGHACSYVKKIGVNVRYDELKVYIPREIPRGSCGFDSVKTHELKHVATEEAVLREHLPHFYDKLKSYLRYNGSYMQLNRVDRYDGLDESVRHVETIVEKIINDEFMAMDSEPAARQKPIDNPEEYRHVNTSCKGQLMNVAEAFRQRH